MKMKFITLFLMLLFFSCSSRNEKGTVNALKDENYSSSSANYNRQEDEIAETNEEEDEAYVKGIENGRYSATVDYHNRNTGYSTTYTLDVEVENGEVTIIYFPNSGYIDSDHISPGELDENGYVEIEGEDGKSYQVQIDL